MINTYMEGYKLFIDTSGFIALLSKKEKKHMEANTFFRYIVEKNIIQITTNLIISELIHSFVITKTIIFPTVFLKVSGVPKKPVFF